MRRKRAFILLAALAILVILAVGGNYVRQRRGVPFVREHEQWSIGIYSGESPFEFPAWQGLRNPVMRAEDVTDVPAKFVADPFLIRDASTWYLFFEVYNLNSKQGDLAVATSTDAKNWKYQQVVLDEPYHLSYPYVFQWQDEYYLIPESFESESIQLYKASEFPFHWSLVETLVDGMALVDPSIAHYDDRWWLFAAEADNANDTLRLFYADELEGPWQEHPESPIVEGDANIARPGGRLLVYDEKLFRYTQDSDPTYGNQIWAFEITELTPDNYDEVLHDEMPVLVADGTGWNGEAMHNIDPHQIDEKRWIAAVDGFGTYLVFGLEY